MANFNEVYDQFLALSSKDRIDAARGAATDVLSFLNEHNVSEEFKSSFFIVLIGTFIGVDGVVTQAEVDIFNAIFTGTFTSKDLVGMISKLCTKENVEALDKLVDSMPEEIKLSACVLALTVVSADGSIGEDERAYFEKLLA